MSVDVARRPAEVPRVRPVVKGTIGQAISRIEPREFGEIIELIEGAGNGSVIPQRSKVSSVNGVVQVPELWSFRERVVILITLLTAVRTVEHAVGTSKDLHFIYAAASQGWRTQMRLPHRSRECRR